MLLWMRQWQLILQQLASMVATTSWQPLRLLHLWSQPMPPMHPRCGLASKLRMFQDSSKHGPEGQEEELVLVPMQVLRSNPRGCVSAVLRASLSTLLFSHAVLHGVVACAGQVSRVPDIHQRLGQPKALLRPGVPMVHYACTQRCLRGILD